MGMVKSPGKEFVISWTVKSFSEFKATESPFGHLVKAHSFVSLGQDLKHYLLNKIPGVVKQKNQGALSRLKMNTWMKVFSQSGKMNLWLRAFAVQCGRPEFKSSAPTLTAMYAICTCNSTNKGYRV